MNSQAKTMHGKRTCLSENLALSNANSIKFISNKETSRTPVALNFGLSGKDRNNPRQYGTIKLPPAIRRKLPQYALGDQTVKARKIASRKVSSLAF